jgi:hypothetical protein
MDQKKQLSRYDNLCEIEQSLVQHCLKDYKHFDCKLFNELYLDCIHFKEQKIKAYKKRIAENSRNN